MRRRRNFWNMVSEISFMIDEKGIKIHRPNSEKTDQKQTTFGKNRPKLTDQSHGKQTELGSLHMPP